MEENVDGGECGGTREGNLQGTERRERGLQATSAFSAVLPWAVMPISMLKVLCGRRDSGRERRQAIGRTEGTRHTRTNLVQGRGGKTASLQAGKFRNFLRLQSGTKG